ncbi:MAG: D-alanine--D-alanine ligase [Lachnospiraceae bacterium]|nr:D-alanine--D-alanine ligase [Lachnospiraceae bacterium]
MKIVVLAGGTSTERDVSFVTGQNIYSALKENGHDAIIVDPYMGYEGETEGLFGADIDWTSKISAIGENDPDIEKIKAMRPAKYTGFFGPNVIKLCKEADVVFMALHGENGENGKIQAAFDLEGIKYTGTDTLSSAVCLNKSLAKEIMAYNGIPTPKSVRMFKGSDMINSIGYPCVVKANNGGSSVGVSIANDEEEYKAALADSFKYDDEIIIEQYIKGREFSVGVIEGKALPIIEIAPIKGFYDYKNKYQEGSTVETCPAEIDDIKTKQMQQYAERAFTVLRLRDYARMDFMMSQDGQMYCLEANTLPGMTNTSLIPVEAKAAGISFNELLEKIIMMAVNRK